MVSNEIMHDFKLKYNDIIYDNNFKGRYSKDVAYRAFHKIIVDLGDDYVIGINIELCMIDSAGISRQYIGHKILVEYPDSIKALGRKHGQLCVKRKFNHAK
jgi:hypothetical protein